jgi:hypothetical protein
MGAPTLAEMLAQLAGLAPRARATALRALADTIDDAEDARDRALGRPVPDRDRRGGIRVRFVRTIVRPGDTDPDEVRARLEAKLQRLAPASPGVSDE